MESRLVNKLSLLVPTRLINLLAWFEGLFDEVGERRDGPDPGDLENEVSGPRLDLDLGLSCCDPGRSDSRLIQEPREGAESRAPSLALAAATSPERTYDCRLLLVGGMGEAMGLLGVGGWRADPRGFEYSGEGWDGSW